MLLYLFNQRQRFGKDFSSILLKKIDNHCLADSLRKNKKDLLFYCFFIVFNCIKNALMRYCRQPGWQPVPADKLNNPIAFSAAEQTNQLTKLSCCCHAYCHSFTMAVLRVIRHPL